MYSHDAGGLKAPDSRGESLTATQTTGRLGDQFHFQSPRLDSDFNTPARRSEAMVPKEVVRIEDRQDRWRFVCPRGHRSWEPTNHHFWCQYCARSDEADGVFHELLDKKTGAELERERVRLVTEAGPYDRDLDGKEESA